MAKEIKGLFTNTYTDINRNYEQTHEKVQLTDSTINVNMQIKQNCNAMARMSSSTQRKIEAYMGSKMHKDGVCWNSLYGA